MTTGEASRAGVGKTGGAGDAARDAAACGASGTRGAGAACGEGRLRAGQVVRHFKRLSLPPEELRAGSTRYLYRYLGVTRHSETQEPLALYEALYPPFGTWVRPLAMFMGEVDSDKYPDCPQRYRFEAVDGADLAGAGRPR